MVTSWGSTAVEDPQRNRALQAARAAQQTLGEHADWAETHGYLAPAALQALVAAEVPRLYLPQSLGGQEVSPSTCAAVCETLADADPAAAWHVMVYNAARLVASHWPAELVEAVWGKDPDAMVCASGHSTLRGERVAGGFQVSGRNGFVSGVHHADYVMSPMDVDGIPHSVLLPADQIEIIDNWDTLGMRGSGSNDVRVDGLFVDVAMAVDQSQATARNKHYEGRLYHCPTRVVFATYVPVALSLARRAIEFLEALAQDKVPAASDKKLKERSIAQIHYGKALAQYRAVRGYFYAALDDVWARASQHADFDDGARADLYLAGVHTLQSSADIVRHVADAAGSSVLYRHTPLERIVRDMETLRHHGFANESRYGSVTQVLWGAALDYPLVLR